MDFVHEISIEMFCMGITSVVMFPVSNNYGDI